jgi:hypothetical protein
MMTLRERLERKMIITPGCWIWKGKRDRDGYGLLVQKLEKPVTQKAHRVAYELYVGEIPNGFLVRHKCDNPSCVNPDHLEVGTHADNMLDKKMRGRAVSLRGDQCGRAKITSETAMLIRNDKRPKFQISAEFGISLRAIYDVQNLKTWTHI